MPLRHHRRQGAVWNCHHCGWCGAENNNGARAHTTSAAAAQPLDFKPLPTEAYAWFKGRGIGSETLARAGVGWTSRWIPAKKAEVACLAFRYCWGGKIVNAKFRTLDKQFAQLKDGEKVVYLADLVDPEYGDRLVIVEGEIDALSLLEAGVHNAVSVPDGAPEKVKDGLIDPVEDRKFAYVWNCRELLAGYPNIVLATDADIPGRALAEELARRIGAERCWLVTWPGGCKDANDVLVRHGPAALAACIEQAQPYQLSDGAARLGSTPTGTDVALAVKRLAKLSPLEYDRCRQEEATRLRVRVGTLDDEVAAAREGGGGVRQQGRAIELPTPEPAPEPVAGAALLDALANAVSRFVALPEHGAAIVALWAVHTHCVDATSITPRLAITSPTKRCGKSTLLRLLAKIVAKPLAAENVTSSALYRTIEKVRPTLLIDEADTFLTGSDELRGILNSGHHQDGAVIRTSGDDFEPRAFSTWAAVAIAAIGKLPGTIQDRAIPMLMRRRRPDEPIERFRSDRCEDLKLLGRQAARWAADYSSALGAADPEIPAALHDREADNWRPLLAIADQAGGDWPARARAAAKASAGTADGDDDAAGVELLADIKRSFTDAGKDRMSSAELVKHLTALEDRRWCEWKNGKPMTVRQLARLLAPYGIFPSTIRIGETTPKGYIRASFTDSFARYLPSDPQHRHNPQESADFGAVPSATIGAPVADRKCPKAKETATCGGVADGREGSEGEMASTRPIASPAANGAAGSPDEMPEIPTLLDRRPKRNPPAISEVGMGEWIG